MFGPTGSARRASRTTHVSDVTASVAAGNSARKDLARFAEACDPEPVRIQPDSAPARDGTARRLVHRLIGQPKRAPMHAEHEWERLAMMRCDKILVDLHRFLGIRVDDVHEPARIVSSDGKQHEIERT